MQLTGEFGNGKRDVRREKPCGFELRHVSETHRREYAEGSTLTLFGYV
jgi:hypothetical protein